MGHGEEILGTEAMGRGHSDQEQHDLGTNNSVSGTGFSAHGRWEIAAAQEHAGERICCHCIIVLLERLQHEAATRTVHRNFREEIQNIVKCLQCLLKMFALQDMEDCHKVHNWKISASVVSNEVPTYFKKAIDEA